jgi:hypothetical protein
LNCVNRPTCIKLHMYKELNGTFGEDLNPRNGRYRLPAFLAILVDWASCCDR